MLRILGLFILTFSIRANESNYLSLGDDALASGDYEDAIQYYRRGLERETDLLTKVSLYTNLGTSLSAVERDKEAVTAYQSAILEYRKDPDATATDVVASAAFFLGMTFQDMQQTQQALQAYQYAYELDPLYWSAYANQGSIFHDKLADYASAVDAYQHAVRLLTSPTEPTDAPPEPQFVLSQLQYRIGLCLSSWQAQNPDDCTDCLQRAAHALSQAVSDDSDNEVARHMLAALTADGTMERASNTFVESLFESYAATFEHSLVNELQYTGYERLRRGFDRALPDLTQRNVVVDAGCGTGLVGEQFRNVSQILIGVDLSASIIEQAIQKRPGLYDDTRVGDIVEIFKELRNTISLIVAADSYIYFGDLVPLFEAMVIGLEADGYIAFTLENVAADMEQDLQSSKPDWRWQLTASGRFAHRQSYVESVARDHGLRVVHYEPMNGFRYEHGVEVRGHLFVLQLMAGKDEL